MNGFRPLALAVFDPLALAVFDPPALAAGRSAGCGQATDQGLVSGLPPLPVRLVSPARRKLPGWGEGLHGSRFISFITMFYDTLAFLAQRSGVQLRARGQIVFPSMLINPRPETSTMLCTERNTRLFISNLGCWTRENTFALVFLFELRRNTCRHVEFSLSPNPRRYGTAVCTFNVVAGIDSFVDCNKNKREKGSRS